MSCQAQTGLLILRACGEPEVTTCVSCGIPLCALHAGAGTCPNCLVTGGHANDSDLGREAASRSQYYESYGKRTEFGAAGYFSGADRQALASRHKYDPMDT